MAQALEGAGGLCTSTQALKRCQAERPAEERLVDLARCLDEFGVPQRDGLLDLIGSAHGAQLTSSRGRSTRGYSVARPALLVLPIDAASPTRPAKGIRDIAVRNPCRCREICLPSSRGPMTTSTPTHKDPRVCALLDALDEVLNSNTLLLCARIDPPASPDHLREQLTA